MTAFANSALNSSVLVLNRQYMAIHVVDVRRAFVLLMRRLAEVIHIEDGQYANYDFESWREVSELQVAVQRAAPGLDPARQFRDPGAARAPAVALRSRAEAAVRFNRRNIFARDSNQCQYCGKRFPTSELSLDHIVPTCRGGETAGRTSSARA